MFPGAMAQKQPPVGGVAGGVQPSLGTTTSSKRPLDEEIQFISSNPVKRRKTSAREPSAPAATQPDQTPALAAGVGDGSAGRSEAPPAEQKTSIATAAADPPSKLADDACENSANLPASLLASLPAMENFAFPGPHPMQDYRPTRASEAISPKQLPQAEAPNQQPPAEASDQQPPHSPPQPVSAPPFPTVNLAQISCLGAMGPQDPTATDMTNFGQSSIAPNEPTSQHHPNQSGYLPLNPNNAHAFPLAMYSSLGGGLVPFPNGGGPWTNPTNFSAGGIAATPELNSQAQSQQAQAGGTQAGSKQAPTAEGGGAPSLSLASRQPSQPGSMPPSRTHSFAPVVAGQAPVPKPPCPVCIRARQQQRASRGQGQNAAHRGHASHVQGAGGTTPSFPPFWGTPLPSHYFNAGGLHGMGMHSAGMAPPPLPSMPSSMPTSGIFNNQQHHLAGGNYIRSMPQPAATAAFGPSSAGLGAHMLPPSHYHPATSAAARPPAASHITPSNNGPGYPKSNPTSGMPTPTLTGSNGSTMPVPVSTPATCSNTSTTGTSTAPAPHAPKQPTPGSPSPPPVAVAKRKHAQNLLVDVAETVEEIFPFQEVARRHGVLPLKVVEALAAVVQVPLLRCAIDKRRAGKLGGDRIKEYREARKAWMAREAEAAKMAKAAGEEPDANGRGRMVPSAAQLASLLAPTAMPSVLADGGAFSGPW